jgi:[protein-PII] uridylyltransferase
MPVDPHLKPAHGKTSSPSASLPADFHSVESARIRREFETGGDGRAATRERSALADKLLEQLYRECFADLQQPGNFCLVALGGYGRGELYPHSDIDLLFLCADTRTAASEREAVATISRTLWDLRFRVGCTARTLAECGQLHRDNLEFNIALLDSRYLAGDSQLLARLRERAIPRLVARDHRELVQNLAEMTRRRHEKYGNTIFHLEPNLKETPGGLRDYQVARWLALIVQLERHSRWTAPEELWPPSLRAESRRAFDYLCATRCFLHYQQGRDDNQLSYELQDRAASLRIGHRLGESTTAAEWMRHYFRHARTIYRLATQLLEDARPVRSSLYAAVQDWKSGLSNADFSVRRGRIFPRQPEAVLNDPGLVLGPFELMARSGLELGREAESWVEESLPRLAVRPPQIPDLWSRFRRILLLPHAARTLRAMHRLGLLVALFPEFHAIDALVVRDFYHRYTVDEHSLMTLQSLEALRSLAAPAERGLSAAVGDGSCSPDAAEVWNSKFGEILSELEQPELLSLALLFHDVGKGLPGSSHVTGSLEALEAIFARLELAPEERETVRSLVAQHLEMSATLQRRDVFDPETVRAFAEQVGTIERLKMLCLLTYADIKSVNPEALTPWKAEMLWQLSVAAANYLTRSLDEERLHVVPGGLAQAQRILPLLSSPATELELDAFLEGFPKRYLAAHSPEEIAAHFELARRLGQNPVQVRLQRRHRLFELTVLTADRPLLFASLTGTLAAWGMNIVKADAFANASRTILDTFRFADLYRTLELNPSEMGRLTQSVVTVLSGQANLEDLMSSRMNPRTLPRPKVKIETEIRFDDSSSTHSTLLELITQDRPGLLHQASSTLAELGCNIEVALIDTEGQKVIDVFYLTCAGAKLDLAMQNQVCQALLERL